MPCNAGPVSYDPDFVGGDLVVVTPDGKVDRGHFSPTGSRKGYISHFATCPYADRYRKGAK